MRPSNVSLSFTMNFTADWAALRAISSASFGRCPSGTGLYGQMCLEASTGSGKADVSSSQKTISTSSGLHKWQPQSNWYDIKWFELALNEPRFTLHQRVVSDKHLVGLGCQTLKHSFDSILLHRADFDLRLTAILFLTLATAARNTKLMAVTFAQWLTEFCMPVHCKPRYEMLWPWHQQAFHHVTCVLFSQAEPQFAPHLPSQQRYDSLKG